MDETQAQGWLDTSLNWMQAQIEIGESINAEMYQLKNAAVAVTGVLPEWAEKSVEVDGVWGTAPILELQSPAGEVFPVHLLGLWAERMGFEEIRWWAGQPNMVVSVHAGYVGPAIEPEDEGGL